MNPNQSAIPVLGFRAGQLSLAIAAEDVLVVEPSVPDAIHVAKILAVEAEQTERDRRLIRVRTQPSDERSDHKLDSSVESVAFAADPPVEMLLCRPQHIVPTAPSISLGRRYPVMGFAEIDQRLWLLLDLERLIRALRHLRAGGEL